jgi:hypothetical protein
MLPFLVNFFSYIHRSQKTACSLLLFKSTCVFESIGIDIGISATLDISLNKILKIFFF